MPSPGFTQCEACLETARGYRNQLRDAVFAAYGGYRCACPGCDVTRREFLEIDHIRNNGADHRRELKNRNLYVWLRQHNYPEGFQVLCANCNHAKGYYGYCPHWDEKDVSHADWRHQVRIRLTRLDSPIHEASRNRRNG